MTKKLAVINQSKFLGVTLESHLGWSAHIKKTIIPFIKVFARCLNLLSENDKRSLYFSLIHPHVAFLCNVWGHYPAQHLERLSLFINEFLLSPSANSLGSTLQVSLNTAASLNN